MKTKKIRRIRISYAIPHIEIEKKIQEIKTKDLKKLNIEEYYSIEQIVEAWKVIDKQEVKRVKL